MGFSPIDYFIRLKIQVARKYLHETNEKINVIAHKLGYYDAFSFSKQFKKFTGLSPRAFRDVNGNQS